MQADPTIAYQLWRALRVMPCRCARRRKDRPAPADCARCQACTAYERENPECLATLNDGVRAGISSANEKGTESYS